MCLCLCRKRNGTTPAINLGPRPASHVPTWALKRPSRPQATNAEHINNNPPNNTSSSKSISNIGDNRSDLSTSDWDTHSDPDIGTVIAGCQPPKIECGSSDIPMPPEGLMSSIEKEEAADRREYKKGPYTRYRDKVAIQEHREKMQKASNIFGSKLLDSENQGCTNEERDAFRKVLCEPSGSPTQHELAQHNEVQVVQVVPGKYDTLQSGAEIIGWSGDSIQHDVAGCGTAHAASGRNSLFNQPLVGSMGVVEDKRCDFLKGRHNETPGEKPRVWWAPDRHTSTSDTRCRKMIQIKRC